MNVNFESIEKAWFKPKKDEIKVNLDLKGIKNLENYITDLEQNRHVLDELEEDIKRQITFCTNEAEGTVNNDKCWMAVNYLKHLLNKIQELKKENENGNYYRN